MYITVQRNNWIPVFVNVNRTGVTVCEEQTLGQAFEFVQANDPDATVSTQHKYMKTCYTLYFHMFFILSHTYPFHRAECTHFWTKFERCTCNDSSGTSYHHSIHLSLCLFSLSRFNSRQFHIGCSCNVN